MGAEALKRGTEGTALGAPEVDEEHIIFRLSDTHDRYKQVQLYQELNRPRRGPRFGREGLGRWELRWKRPPVGRLEYAFVVTHRDGTSETIVDPSNPLSAAGPFGAKSVVELPGYRPPPWIQTVAEPGLVATLSLRSNALRRSIEAVLWSAPALGEGEAAPLLVVHDGPELAHFSDLIKLLEHLQAEQRVPPMRAALLAPADRNESYSASPRYARALATELLPALGRIAPRPQDARSATVGMGVSLGALAMLHAQRVYPGSFGGLFLQSGSFFRRVLDRQESAWPRFSRICRFVETIDSEPGWDHPIPVSMTCGSVEENLANNQALARTLVRQGYDVSFAEHPDGHNWIAWRDSFEPHLSELLRRVWG